MKGFRSLCLMSALALAACDGARSPDFASETVLESIVITDEAGTPIPDSPRVELAIGSTEQFRVQATGYRTLPPGSPDASDTDNNGQPDRDANGTLIRRGVSDVTSDAAWSSSNTARVTVSDSGEATGVSEGDAVITATVQGKSDTVNVTVTPATLAGGSVRCVRLTTEDNICPAVATAISAPVDRVVPLKLIGRFSDGVDRPIGTPPYTLTWGSSDTAVASKVDSPDGNNFPLAENRFITKAIGTANLTGTVVAGANPPPVPAAASRALNVVAPNAFCDAEFGPASQIVEQLCIGCSVDDTDPSSITDGNLDTFASLNIPLGLLLFSNVSVTVANPVGVPSIAPGSPAGFLLSRASNNILSAQLLSSLSLVTVRRTGADTFEEIDDPATANDLLRLTLLGIRLPASPQFLLSTGPTTEAYDGIKLTFHGGLATLLASLNVNTACSRANPNPPAAP